MVSALFECHAVTVCCLCVVPGARVEGLRVDVVCPSGLRLLWEPPSQHLLGGPENETQYLLTFTLSSGHNGRRTFDYSSMLSVSPLTLCVCISAYVYIHLNEA